MFIRYKIYTNYLILNISNNNLYKTKIYYHFKV